MPNKYLAQLSLANGLVTGGEFDAIAPDDLPLFTSVLAGAVPASGGGTTNFLRADGAWAVAGTGTVTSIAAGAGLTGGTITATGAIALDLAHANSWTALQTFNVSPTSLWGSGTSINERWGAGAGNNTCTGDNNTVFGHNALKTVTSGDGNTAIGGAVLSLCTSGGFNTAVGMGAMQNLTTGSGNTGLGWNSLIHVTTGNYNTGLGYNILAALTTGTQNTGAGYGCLASLTTAAQATAAGYSALAALTTGTSDAAFGASAAPNLTTASLVTAIGTGACYGVTTGDHNTGVGYAALVGVTSGADNVQVGVIPGFGQTLSTGNFNVLLGNRTDTAAAGTSLGVALGYLAVCTDNEAAWGPYVNVQTGYTFSSTAAWRQRADFTDSNVDNTDATRKYRRVFNVWDTAAREVLRGEASGAAPLLGFLGAAAVARQNITGVRTGTLAQLQTVMANLLTGLANLGLITDSTT